MDKFEEIIKNSKKIFLCSHKFPDWDAVCSMLSMYDYLSKAYSDKEYGLYFAEENPYQSFSFLKNYEKIQWVKDIVDIINDYDTLIFLDGNTIDRFAHEEEKIDLSKFKSICIDHHPNQADNFTLDFSEVGAASCSQLIYKYFFRNRKELLDREVAEVILTGILGDTGTFRYLSYKSSETFTIGKELIDFGKFDVQTLELRLSQMEPDEFELLKLMIAKTTNVELQGKPPFTYSYLPLEVRNKFDSELIKSANAKYKNIILRQVKNHNWGFVVTPDYEDTLGISFRSTPGGPNVRKLAEAFNGGGHFMAAGGNYQVNDKVKDSEDLCKLLVEYIKNNDLEMTESF